MNGSIHALKELYEIIRRAGINWTIYCSDVFPSSQHTVFLNTAAVLRCWRKDKIEKVGQWKGRNVKVDYKAT